MVAFVTPSAGAITSTSSNFITGTSTKLASSEKAHPSNAITTKRSANVPRMTILRGLDTINQDSYSFSRYILGPFQPTILSPNSCDEEREIAIRAAYRQVFGNAYLMDEERAELQIAESQYKMGNITAREFVRCLALSNAYKTRFVEGCSVYRTIELNFMHLLGRAPDTREEMTYHHNLQLQNGVDVDIHSYIDSDEYSSVFGQDNIPFLRFRGAYTPCDSFNKQCALKGGWANSDKAMGGAAITGYNGSDGRNLCNNITSYISGVPTAYENVAKDTPLKTTAPNWVAYPNPAVPSTPAYITPAEVNEMSSRVQALQKQYDFEISRKQKDHLKSYRDMVQDMAPMLERGFAYSDPILANPDAKLYESPLDNAGGKDSDYQRVGLQMFNDTVSRLEFDLEEAKSQLRVMKKALDNSTPMSGSVVLPSLSTSDSSVGTIEVAEPSRPRITVSKMRPKSTAAAVEEEKKSFKIGPVSIPIPSLPSVSLPSVSLPSVSLPFGKKE